MKKLLCGLLLAGGVVLSASSLVANAAPTYGSNVTRNSASTYGYAWTQSSGQTVRARIVIGGQVADSTNIGWVQTNQISGSSANTAYVNHYENGSLIASYTK